MSSGFGYTSATSSTEQLADLSKLTQKVCDVDPLSEFRGKCELLERNILPSGMIVLLSPEWNGGRYGVCVQSSTIEDCRRIFPDASDASIAEQLAAFATAEHKKKQEEARRG